LIRARQRFVIQHGSRARCPRSRRGAKRDSSPRAVHLRPVKDVAGLGADGRLVQCANTFLHSFIGCTGWTCGSRQLNQLISVRECPGRPQCPRLEEDSPFGAARNNPAERARRSAPCCARSSYKNGLGVMPIQNAADQTVERKTITLAQVQIPWSDLFLLVQFASIVPLETARAGSRGTGDVQAQRQGPKEPKPFVSALRMVIRPMKPFNGGRPMELRAAIRNTAGEDGITRVEVPCIRRSRALWRPARRRCRRIGSMPRGNTVVICG